MADLLEKEFHISQLITAKLNGVLSLEQDVELQAWKNASPDHLAFYNDLLAEDRFLSEFKKFNQTDTTGIWKMTEAGLKANMHAPVVGSLPARIQLWSRLAAVAAAVALIVLGVYFFKSPLQSEDEQNSELVKHDIAAGRNAATITLANGKVIQLSDVKDGVMIGQDGLKYTDGELLTGADSETGSSQTGQVIIASTTKGQTYEFTLPDGTKVWLNADSKISFAQQFVNKTRNVILEGEAYFEVAKDKQHPFIVATKGQQIEVLGTHFNVNSYLDEPGTATTLLEGSVRIKVGNVHRIIKPGEQALNRSGLIDVRKAELDNVVDWKNGDFYLNHVEFKTAMRKIARWYNMEVIYDENVPDNMESGGWIARDKPLSAVLRSIESSDLVKFRVEGRKIYVRQ